MRSLRKPFGTTRQRPTTHEHHHHTLLRHLVVLLFTLALGGTFYSTPGLPSRTKMPTGRPAPLQRTYLNSLREDVRTPLLTREDVVIEETRKQHLADGIKSIMERQDVYGEVEITAWHGVLPAEDAMLSPNDTNQAAERYKATAKITLLPTYVARQLRSALPQIPRQVSFALVDVDVAASRFLSALGSNLVKEFDGTMRLNQNTPGPISGRGGVRGRSAAALHRKKIQQNLPLKLRTDYFECDASGVTKIAPEGSETLQVGADKRRNACNCLSKITVDIHRAPLSLTLAADCIVGEAPVEVRLEDIQFYLLVNFFMDHNHVTGFLRRLKRDVGMQVYIFWTTRFMGETAGHVSEMFLTLAMSPSSSKKRATEGMQRRMCRKGWCCSVFRLKSGAYGRQ